MADLLGIPAYKVNDDRLYRALDRLLPHKVEMEKHLKERLGELFNLEYDLLLYDVTSTYFEGGVPITGKRCGVIPGTIVLIANRYASPWW